MRCVVAFSAVGSLKEEVKPRDFVVVDQVIDWTRGVSGFKVLPQKDTQDHRSYDNDHGYRGCKAYRSKLVLSPCSVER